MFLGIAGKAHAGKTTCADYLQRTQGYVSLAFADPLYALVEDLLDMSYTEIQQNKEVVVPWVGKTPRKMLQSLGTEWGRDMIHPDLWVNSLMNKARNLDFKRVVASDVRFPNEAQAIRDNGGTVIHIYKPNSSSIGSHVSEAGLDVLPGDFLIINDGNKVLLFNKLDWIINGIKTGAKA